MMSKIKEFLKRDDIQKYLQMEDLDKVYRTYLEENNNLAGCAEITKVFLKSGIDPLEYVREIYPYMYSGLPIENITIPQHITSIDDYAFYCCDDLDNIIMSNNIDYIGEGAFRYCRNLTRITIPELVDEVLPNTFEGCSGMKVVNVIGQFTELPEDDFFCSGNFKIRCYEDSVAHQMVLDDYLPYELI